MIWEQRGLTKRGMNFLGETRVGAGTVRPNDGGGDGAKPSLIPERVTQLRARVAAGEKKAALAREFGISRETLYSYAPVNA